MITKKPEKKWAKPQRVPTPLLFFRRAKLHLPRTLRHGADYRPFNYPMNLVFEPLIGAISGGNCAVIKTGTDDTECFENQSLKSLTRTSEKNYIRVIEGDRQATAELINAPFDYLLFHRQCRYGKDGHGRCREKPGAGDTGTRR